MRVDIHSWSLSGTLSARNIFLYFYFCILIVPYFLEKINPPYPHDKNIIKPASLAGACRSSVAL